MSEASGQFTFSDNLEQVRQNIQTNLRGIVSDLETTGGALNGKDFGAGFLDSFSRNLATEGTKIIQQVEQLASEINGKLQSGKGTFSLPTGGFAGALQGGENFGAQGQQRIKEFLDAQLKSLPDSVRANPQAQDVISRAINELYTQIAKSIREQRTNISDTARENGVSPAAAVGGVGGDVGLGQIEQFFGTFIAEFRGGVSEFARDIEKFQAEGREVAERIKAASSGGGGQLAPADARAVAQGAAGQGPLANSVTPDVGRQNFAVQVEPGVFAVVTGDIVKGFEEGSQILERVFKEANAQTEQAVRKATLTATEQGARLISAQESGEAVPIKGRAGALAFPETKEIGQLNSAGDAVDLNVNQERRLRLIFEEQIKDAKRREAEAAQKEADAEEKRYQSALAREQAYNNADNAKVKAEIEQARILEERTSEEARAAQQAFANEQRRQNAQRDVGAKAGIETKAGTFSSEGLTDVNGRLVTDYKKAQQASEQLAVEIEKLDAALSHAAKTPLDGLVQGLFGAGGRKRTGGAQPVDQDSPLFGLFETAGVVAKYEVLGRGIASLGQAATGAVKDFASLDEATRNLNEIFGSSITQSDGVIANLENVAASAGVASEALIKAATSAGAAFGGDTGQGRLDAATAAAPSIAANTAVTGQDPASATADIVAIGKAYGLAAEQLGDITNAVANARNAFGGNITEIQKGVAGLAEVGKNAGFSLSDLTVIVGKVQATTTEGGAAIATNLTRIINTLSTTSTRQNLAQVLGIELNGNISNQLGEIASKYGTLNTSQRNFLASTAGGAKGLRDLEAILSDYPGILQAQKKAQDDTTAGQRAAEAAINSLAGQIRQLGTDFKNLGVDLAKTGILDPFIAAFAVIKPLVEEVDRLIQAFDKLPEPIKAFGATVLEATIAYNAFKLLREKNVLSSVTGLGADIGGVLLGQKTGPGGARVGGLLGNPFGGGAGAVDSTAGLKAAQEKFAATVAEGTAATEAALLEQKALEAEITAFKSAEARGAASFATVRIAAEEELSAAIARAAVAAEANAVALAEAAAEVAAARAAKTAADAEAVAVVGSEGIQLRAAFQSVVASILTASAEIKEAGLGATLAANVGAGRIVAGGAFGKLLAPAEGAASAGLLARAGGAIGATTAEGGAIGFGLGTSALAAGALAFGIGKTLSSELKQIDLQGKLSDAVTAGNAGTSPDSLIKSADAIDAASKKLQDASSGFFGSIAGAFTGGDRGAAEAKNLADAQREAAKEITTATADAAAKGQSGGVDLSAANGVADFLKLIKENGGTAAETLKVLNDALKQASAAADEAAKKTLLPGQAAVAAAKGAASELDSLKNNAANDASGGQGDGNRIAGRILNGGNPGGSTRRIARSQGIIDSGFKGFDLKKFQEDEDKSIAQAISDNKLDDGSPITADKKKAAIKEAQDHLIAVFKAQGVNFAKLPKDVQEQLLNGVRTGLSIGLGETTGAIGKNITPENVNAILTAAPQIAAQDAKDAAVQAGLGNGPAGQGAALVDANKNLADLQEIAKNAANTKGFDPQKLAEVNTAIQAAELAVQNAQIAQVVQLDQAAKDLNVSQFDKLGGLQADAQAIADQLNGTANSPKVKDPVQRAILEGKAKQNANAQADQAVADAASAARLSVDSRSVVGNAQANLDDANRKLTEVTKRGGKGQDLTDAQKRVNDATVALAQANVDQANGLRDANIAVGDKVGEAYAKAKDLTAQAAADLAGTAKAAQDARAAAQALADANLQADAAAGATAIAKIDPRNLAAIAKQTLANDRKIQQDTPTADTAAQAAIAQRIAQDIQRQRDLAVQLANDSEESRIDSRDTTAEARAKVDEATRTLRNTLKGTPEFAKAVKALADAKIAYAQAQTDLANAIRETGVFPGDALGAASAAVQTAQANLKNDKFGTLKYYQDLKALRDSQVAYARAIEDQQNVLEQLGSDQTNPVIQAQNALDAARRKLADDRKLGAPADVIQKDQLAVTAAQNNEQRTAFQQQLSDASTNLQLHRISGAAYLQYLETLRKNILATGLKTRQQVDELNQVDQAILSANQQLQGQFNLGDIKVPTVFQERVQAALNKIDVKGVGGVTPLTPVDPLQQKANDVIAPLSAAVDGIKTDQAIKALADLQAQINKLAGGIGPVAQAIDPTKAKGPAAPASPVAGTTLAELQKLQAALTSNTGVYQRLAAINTPGFKQADEARLKALIATDASKLASDRSHHASTKTIAADTLALSQAKAQLSQVTNAVTINGADITKVIAYLNSVLGRAAVNKAAPLTGRKVR